MWNFHVQSTFVLPLCKTTFSVWDSGRFPDVCAAILLIFGVVDLLGKMFVSHHEWRMAAVCRAEAGLFVTQLFAAGAHPSCISSAAALTAQKAAEMCTGI